MTKLAFPRFAGSLSVAMLVAGASTLVAMKTFTDMGWGSKTDANHLPHAASANIRNGHSALSPPTDVPRELPRMVDVPRVTPPDHDAPLTARFELSTTTPTQVSFDVRGAHEAWRVTCNSTHRMVHDIPVLGLAPDRAYLINNIRLRGKSGSLVELTHELKFRTAKLPSDFPLISVDAINPNEVTDGYILTSVIRGRPRHATAQHTLVVDNKGIPRWFTPRVMMPVRQLPNGRLLGLSHDVLGGIPCEIDVFGKVHPRWRKEFRSPGTLREQGGEYHHEALLTPAGHLLTFGSETRIIPGFPTSDTDADADRADREVAFDPVIELGPDGAVVNSISLLDILDPCRVGYDAVKSNSAQDWAHSNGIAYDAGDPQNSEDDAILVSVRHQDALVKLSYPSGKLIWILGPHEGWDHRFRRFLLTPPTNGEFQWSYHQHAPSILPNGHIMLFDNGNHRASPFFATPQSPSESYSRAVEYVVNEDTRRVAQVWQYGGSDSSPEERIYSPFSGDAEWLPETNNVLITFSRPSYIGGEPQMVNEPRVIEVTRRGNRVFCLRVSHRDADASVYRSQRITGLYPQEFTVSSIPTQSAVLGHRHGRE